MQGKDDAKPYSLFVTKEGRSLDDAMVPRIRTSGGGMVKYWGIVHDDLHALTAYSPVDNLFGSTNIETLVLDQDTKKITVRIFVSEGTAPAPITGICKGDI